MNRLRKILTLGLEKKRAWQLPIIAALLVLFGLGVRWWYNSRAVKGIRLLDMVDINDVEGVRWICRWDKKQVNEEGEVTGALRDGGRLYTYEPFPLFLAAGKGHTGIVKILLKAGANVNAKDKYNLTPLPLAALDHVRTGSWLGWPGGETPLHQAADRGHTEVVKILLKAGAKVNAKENRGNTPLHSAVSGGHAETVKILLVSGANVNAKTEYGRTPLHAAALQGARMGEILLKAGAKINAKDINGETVLHWVALKGETETAKILLKAGAEVNVKRKDGWTPLDMTKQRENWLDPKKQDECARLLRKHGAKTGAELDAEARQDKAK